jgi:hypothetical protein
MSTTEFPKPNQSEMIAGINSPMAAERAQPVVLHNSRIVCWLTMGMGVCALFIGLCMMLMVVSFFIPLSALSFVRMLAAAQWGLGGLIMCLMCPWLWKWGWRMMSFNVKLDERGADFNLGTKKKPQELFMSWDQVASIQQKRVGNAQQFTILGTDGSRASFTSYTFFRPKKVARMVAERAGLTIQKA